ncbi:phosphoglycerate kinase [bacterium]|nr:phosphoglycerate kinase [bacterium]
MVIERLKEKKKRVFLRVDFNVKFKGDKILDDFRIKTAKRTIDYLSKYNHKIILATHLGNPKRRISKLSTKKLIPFLEKILKKRINFVDDCIGEKVKEKIKRLNFGGILLLENLRFYKEEKKNSEDFAKKLKELADYYVSEAFSVCHRKHSSVYALPKIMKNYYGFRLKDEIKVLSKVLNSCKKPIILVLGGAKISTKVPLIEFWKKRSSAILLGGVLAIVFLKVKGFNVGRFLVDKEFLLSARKLQSKIILPIDFYAISKNKKIYLTLSDLLKQNNSSFKILDIGEKTLDFYQKILKVGEIIVWNGPMGLIEDKRFSFGSIEMAKIIKKLNKFSVVGGGETLSIFSSKSIEKNSKIFYSTGGGAMLEFLTSKKLPGLKVLGL